ncbi:MAG: hypothetical protein U0Q15_08310 [Kineosporiaceae bacterium]
MSERQDDGADALREALAARAETVTDAALRPDGETRLREALGTADARPAAATRARRWAPLVAAAAVIVVAGSAGVLGVAGRDGRKPSAGVDRATSTTAAGGGADTEDTMDGTAAAVLAAAGVRECAGAETTSRVPERSRIAAVHRCTWGEPQNVPGEGSFRTAQARVVTGGLDAVLDLAQKADGLPRPTPGDDEICPTIAWLPYELWVTLDDGRVVRWQVPWYPRPCGGPDEQEEQAWQALTTRVVTQLRADRLASALALDTGCGDDLKNPLALAAQGASAATEPPQPLSVSGDVTACFYRAGPDGSATLQAAARLDPATARSLGEQIGTSEPDPGCPAGGRGVVALVQGVTVPGHDNDVVVDLDGCAVIAGFGGGWWRAPQSLRDALAAVRARAATAPSGD